MKSQKIENFLKKRIGNMLDENNTTINPKKLENAMFLSEYH